eukprot:Sspe_Gene.14824::Locus_5140_Transcript_1_1_Confidence_1.000_Length_1354::g.14824::m.14824
MSASGTEGRSPRSILATTDDRLRYEDTIQLAYKNFSVRDVYGYHCEKVSVKPLPSVMALLPDRVNSFRDLVELDLSLLHTGEAGVYPVLEAVRASLRMAVLRLSGIGLTNRTMLLVCQLALQHPSLHTVDISHNKFVSAEAGEGLLKVARKNPRLVRVVTDGTSIPHDLNLRLQKLLEQNRKVLFSTCDEAEARSIRFDMAFDSLDPSERHRLHVASLTTRKNIFFGTDTQFGVVASKTAFGAPALTPRELEKVKACFALLDTNQSGLISLPQARQGLRSLLGGLEKGNDAEMEYLFARMDRDDDGFLEVNEWEMLVANIVGVEGAMLKAARLQQYDAAYYQVAEGSGKVLTVADVVQVGVVAMSMVGKDLPTDLEDKLRFLLLESSGATSTTDETSIPMPCSHFKECMMAVECLYDPPLCHAVVHRKHVIQ